MSEFIRFSVALACMVSSLIFIRAALHKFMDKGRFQGVLDDYDILPEGSTKAASVLIPSAEITTGVLLALTWFQPVGAALGAFLLVIYATAMAVSLMRGKSILDCGCGDEPDRVHSGLVIRNILLASTLGLSTAGFGSINTASEASVLWALAILVFSFWMMSEKALKNLSQFQSTLIAASQQKLAGGVL